MSTAYYCPKCDWSFHAYRKECYACGSEDVMLWHEKFGDRNWEASLKFGTGKEGKRGKTKT